MLFVVVREIEQHYRDCHTFTLEAEARRYFDQAHHVCWEEPDDTPGGDQSIVSNCWLYMVRTSDPARAEELALSERAELLEVCFPREGDSQSFVLSIF